MSNCRRCTRWRHLHDYTPVRYIPKGAPHLAREYLRHVCNACIKVARHARYLIKRASMTPAEVEAVRKYQREQSIAKRRTEGVQERVFSGLKSRRNQKREAKRKARRAAGIPARVVGPDNHGIYGMRDVR